MITIKASASGQSASSPLDLCVTHYPPPELRIPVESQFHSDNPSLSSVFIVSNSSSLHQGRPTLRIPSKWSFSIGFDYKTFAANNSLYYSASQADGSPLPGWVDFNAHAMTFNGYTPAPESPDTPLPHTLSLALHASDQQGPELLREDQYPSSNATGSPMPSNSNAVPSITAPFAQQSAGQLCYNLSEESRKLPPSSTA